MVKQSLEIPLSRRRRIPLHTHLITDRLPVVDIFISCKINGSAFGRKVQTFFKQRFVPVYMGGKELGRRDLGLMDHPADQVKPALTVTRVDIYDPRLS